MRAGQKPKTTPVPVEKAKAAATARGLTMAAQPAKRESVKETAAPTRIPMSPPNVERAAASMRNWDTKRPLKYCNIYN